MARMGRRGLEAARCEILEKVLPCNTERIARLRRALAKQIEACITSRHLGEMPDSGGLRGLRGMASPIFQVYLPYVRSISLIKGLFV